MIKCAGESKVQKHLNSFQFVHPRIPSKSSDQLPALLNFLFFCLRIPFPAAPVLSIVFHGSPWYWDRIPNASSQKSLGNSPGIQVQKSNFFLKGFSEGHAGPRVYLLGLDDISTEPEWSSDAIAKEGLASKSGSNVERMRTLRAKGPGMCTPSITMEENKPLAI